MVSPVDDHEGAPEYEPARLGGGDDPQAELAYYAYRQERVPDYRIHVPDPGERGD